LDSFGGVAEEEDVAAKLEFTVSAMIRSRNIDDNEKFIV